MMNNPQQPFSLNKEEQILSFASELDIAAVEVLSGKKNPLSATLLALPKKEVTLDFSAVEVVDTSGLAYVLDLIHSLEEAQHQVKLKNVEPLRSLIKLYDVEKIIFNKQREILA